MTLADLIDQMKLLWAQRRRGLPNPVEDVQAIGRDIAGAAGYVQRTAPAAARTASQMLEQSRRNYGAAMQQAPHSADAIGEMKRKLQQQPRR